MADDPIVLSYHDSLLKASDVALLHGHHWLNDQIISFFFEYLSRDVYPDHLEMLFVSPEVTQCLKMVTPAEVEMFLGPTDAQKKKVIFFALNDNANTSAGGSHWSLLVWSQSAGTFYHFDSSAPSNHYVAEEVMDKLKLFLNCPEAKLKEVKCLQQDNSYDCGVHVIAQAEALSKLVSKSAAEFNFEGVKMLNRQIVNHKREHLINLIEELAEKHQN